MLVYKLTTSFLPSMINKHFRFAFFVEKEGKTLKIKYTYSPKKLEDDDFARELIKDCYAGYGLAPSPAEIEAELPLYNLITLSLDSPDGLVGTAHRHVNIAEYSVSADGSSAGFAKTPIIKGEWAVVLSTHSVLSQKVDVEVEVYVD